MEYSEFLETKKFDIESEGIIIDPENLNSNLYAFQKDIVKWALKRGRAAVFADCGMGKTAIQLEWAQKVYESTGTNVLILAPLSVAEQTKREGIKFGIPVTVCSNMEDVRQGINITNYEKLERFDPDSFVGVVLDESSILKSMSSKTRARLIKSFKSTPFRLCCSATPAPNDYIELANHSEFLGIMSRGKLLPTFFCHNGSNTQQWELKGHAGKKFWEWMATWAVVMSNPRDLGYEIKGFDLPELNIIQTVADDKFVDFRPMSLSQRRQARRDSVYPRSKAAVESATEIIRSGEQCLIWCDLNIESETVFKLLEERIPECSKEIRGSTKENERIRIMENFTNGKLPCLITKPSIAGFGMNWQNCSNMIFLGLSDSYEQYYQAVRRCWRYGQQKPVTVNIIISGAEGPVLRNIQQKDKKAKMMRDQMVQFTKKQVREQLGFKKRKNSYKPKQRMCLPDWREFNGMQ